MADSNVETFQQWRESLNDEEYSRDDVFGSKYLNLDEHSLPWILKHADCFFSYSRGNQSVEEIHFYPYSVEGQDDEVWDKVGQAIGNLQALKKLRISIRNCHEDYEDSINLNWEILAHILSHIRKKLRIHLDGERLFAAEESRSFARAIHGHPTITCFKDNSGVFPYEASDALYSALATLPALESVELSGRLDTRPEDESALANPESLGGVLRIPSLRSVSFDQFSFTPALCQATANALMEGTGVTKLNFLYCSFSSDECAAMMANGLSRNTSVISITVASEENGALFDALAAALPSNSTLRELSFGFSPSDDDSVAPDDNPGAPDDDSGAHVDWSPMFLAMGRNKGLKTLKVDGFDSMENSLCTAMTNGLGLNETLESLEIRDVNLCDDTAPSWCRALSFLRTNTALKSLGVVVRQGDTESCLSAFRIDIAAMLQENASLESLSIVSMNTIKAENYVALITALQDNRTLQKVILAHCGTLELTDDEDKHMAQILKKNFALESLPNIHLDTRSGDVGAILQLNEAGRRYLIEDGSSISKGVAVLSAVRSDINCVFLHLLENPRLCYRSAVEVSSDSTEASRGSANPESHKGKREQGQGFEEGKESRRRRI
jgi:hypothetical protein